MVAFLIMSAKFATLGLLEINKDYGVTIFVHGVTNEILSHGSNYTVVMVMWPKFWQLWYLYERSHHNLNFIRIWPEKNYFLRGTLGSGIGFGFKYGLEILQQCDKSWNK